MITDPFSARRTAWFLMLTAAVAASPAALGDEGPEPASATMPPAPGERAEAASPLRRDPRVLPMVGFEYSRLQGIAVALGAGVGREEPKDEWRGFFLLAEPGQRGLKTMVGAGHVYSSYAAYFARLSWLRTWGEALVVSPHQNYAGVELKGLLMGFSAMAGIYRHLGGRPTDPDWVATAAVGVAY